MSQQTQVEEAPPEEAGQESQQVELPQQEELNFESEEDREARLRQQEALFFANRANWDSRFAVAT